MSKIKPIDIEDSKTQISMIGNLFTTYEDIVKTVFSPNTKADPYKIKAMWGFEDEKGRQAFIWDWKTVGAVENCQRWSVFGDENLLFELFGHKLHME